MPATAVPAARRESYDATDYVLIALVMGLMGAFFWAIRGTRGFGGETGGTLAGLGWAALWLLFSHLGGDGARRPYGSGRMMAAIVFGIAVGGLTGYGVYISWLNGIYQMNVNEVTRPIAPWTGYLMLFVCGIHWGGVTGSFMAWAAPRPPADPTVWAARLVAGAGGAVLGALLVKWLPFLFLPFYDQGYYQVDAYATSARAMRSASTIAQHAGLFLGFLGVELVRRDWRAVQVMLTMALGFAVPFAAGGFWHTLRGAGPDIDWWKNWEMSIGLGGGLAFGLAFYLFNRPEEPPRTVTPMERILAGAVLWFSVGTVVFGAYDGLTRLHAVEVSLVPARGAAFWIFQIIAAGAFLSWTFRAFSTRAQARTTASPPVPLSFLGLVLAVVLLAGYLTSIPGALRLADRVLLTLYTFFISVSLVLVLVVCAARRLAQRRDPAGLFRVRWGIIGAARPKATPVPVRSANRPDDGRFPCLAPREMTDPPRGFLTPHTRFWGS